MTEEQKSDIEYQKAQKAISFKNKITWTVIIFMFVSYIGQVLLAAFGSSVALPLEIITVGTFTIIGASLGLNVLQKNILKTESSETVIEPEDRK